MHALLNSDFSMPADGWSHLMALGEFPNSIHAFDASANGGAAAPRHRRVMQVCDSAAAEAMVAAFNRSAQQPNFIGLLVDRDHESDDPDKTTDAWGWCIALENRADGLWGRIRWTDLGEPAVRGGRFRFLSPVFDLATCQDLGNNRLRPMRLEKLGLTNDPNIRPLRPLTNRAASAPAPADPGIPDNAPQRGREESTMDFKTELLALLGLKPDETDANIALALANRKKRDGDLANELGALRNRAAAAETKLAEHERRILEASVEVDLEHFKAVIVNRDEVKAALLANRDSTLKVLAALKQPAAPDGLDEPLRNRRDARDPAALDAGDALANRRREQNDVLDKVQRELRCTRAQAWEVARKRKPELFG